MEAYEYDAYGRHTVRRPGGSASEVAFDATDDVVAGGASAHGNPFGYTGQRFDAETGLMYYKNRYYSPELGRFMSRDPLGAKRISRKDRQNLYTYGASAPPRYRDPLGFCPMAQGCYRVAEEVYFDDIADAYDRFLAEMEAADDFERDCKNGAFLKSALAPIALFSIGTAGDQFLDRRYPDILSDNACPEMRNTRKGKALRVTKGIIQKGLKNPFVVTAEIGLIYAQTWLDCEVAASDMRRVAAGNQNRSIRSAGNRRRQAERLCYLEYCLPTPPRPPRPFDERNDCIVDGVIVPCK